MKILPICIILLFLTACVPAFGEQELELLEPSVTSPIITSDPQPSLTPTQPATATLSPTILPTFTQELLDTATATITMPPPEPQVTQGASDDPCKPYARKERWGSGKSPDEQWIATSCYESREGESSFLLAYNLNAGKEWRIYYKDYARNGDFERRNQIGVFHWSQDGRFLYTTSYTLLSGCCSIGYQTLLVRLDLETGQQTDIVNFTDNLFGRADFSISPSDRYILYVPQNGENILYILDQDTWKQRQIKLKYKNTGAGFIVMSNNEDKLILLLRDSAIAPKGGIRG